LFDIVSVGHFSVDSIFLPSRKKPFMILGGSVAYVSLAARRLDARVAIISKIGEDFPKAYTWWLKQEDIDMSGVCCDETAQTTSFDLSYSNDLSSRVLRLKKKAPSIFVEDMPNHLKAHVVHIAPIACEIDYEIVEKLRESADVLSIDPQGLVRRFDENGNVTLGPPPDMRVLELVDIFKSSLNEIEAVTGQSDLGSAIKSVHEYGAKIVIVTLGANGAAVSVEGSIHNVPACKPDKVVDPTGAGDVFVGAFLAEYARGRDCSWCSYVGSAEASLVVEGIGPAFLGDRNEIYRRASALYEKEIKE
jgi:sugar/nucleoside kinase (ribokinase family)